MKKFLELLILLLYLPFSSSTPSRFDSSASLAVSDAISEIFTKQNLRFNTIIFGNSSTHLKEISNEINKKFKNSKISHIKDANEWNFEIFDSAVILVESHESYVELVKVRLMNKFPKKLQFLIYIEKFNTTGTELIFTHSAYFDPLIVQLAFFLLPTKNFLVLTRFGNFYDCSENSFVKFINSFDTESNRWEKKLEIKENLTNCEISMGSTHEVPYAYIDKIDKKEKGIVIDIARIVAERGNFRLSIFLFNNFKEYKLGISEVDFEFRPEALTSAYLGGGHLTSTFSNNRMIFKLTPPQKFTNWEKVLLPFDEEIWKFLLITFGVAFLSVFIVNQTPKIFKDLIYGIGVKFPAYNILGTFFGVGQLKLPGGNFARILLMTFVLFCLVIRVAYQGVLFEMMTKEIFKKSPETIEDLYTQNFTIITQDAKWSRKILTEMIPKKRRPKIFYASDYEFLEILENDMSNKSAKLAVLLSEISPDSGGTRLKQPLFSSSAGLGMVKNHFIYWLTEETVKHLISGGIPQHIEEFYYEINFKPQQQKKKEPKVLTADDLHYGFVIWIVATGSALIVFFIELFIAERAKNFWRLIRNGLRNILGIIFIFLWLRKYLKSSTNLKN